MSHFFCLYKKCTSGLWKLLNNVPIWLILIFLRVEIHTTFSFYHIRRWHIKKMQLYPHFRHLVICILANRREGKMHFSQLFKGIGLALRPKPHVYLDTALLKLQHIHDFLPSSSCYSLLVFFSFENTPTPTALIRPHVHQLQYHPT